MTTPDPSSPQIPRRRWRPFYGWYIVAASALSNAILSASFFQGFSAFFLPIESHFGWNRTIISGALSLRQLESGIMSPFVGFLVDRVRPRAVIISGGILTGIGLIGLGLANGIATFYLFFFVISLGTSGVSHVVTWPVVISRWFRRRRGRAMGLAVLGPIFGSPFVVLNTSLVDDYGWRPVLIAYGLIAIVVLTALGAIARDRPERYGYAPDGDAPAAPQAAGGVHRAAYAAPPDPGMRTGQVVKSRAFWLLTAYLAGVFLVNQAFQVHQIPYFVNDIGLTPAAAAVTLAATFVISGVGRIGAGALVDVLDYRLVLLGIAVLMGAAFGYLQLVHVSSLLGATPFIVLFGISVGSMIPLRGALGSLIFGTRNIGSVIGLLQGGAVAAGVAGPLLMGIVFDWRGDYGVAVWVLVGVCVALVPLVLLMESGKTLSERAAGAG